MNLVPISRMHCYAEELIDLLLRMEGGQLLISSNLSIMIDGLGMKMACCVRTHQNLQLSVDEDVDADAEGTPRYKLGM
jgi:hypothetical protein